MGGWVGEEVNILGTDIVTHFIVRSHSSFLQLSHTGSQN